MVQTVKHLPAMQETRVQSLGWEDPLEKEMAAHSILLPEKFHGWRSLVGYSPQGPKESDRTEQLHWFTTTTEPHLPALDRLPATREATRAATKTQGTRKKERNDS